MLIQNGTVLSAGVRKSADIRLSGGVIAEMGRHLACLPGEDVLDASGCYVVSGFIDIHTHGGANVDINAATADDLERIGIFFASHGVTAWQGSVLTDTEEQTLWCIRQVREYLNAGRQGAALAGIHLEGPFLSQHYRGSMPEHLIREKMDMDLLLRYQEAAGGMIRYITLSPEIAGVIESIPAIRALGIHVAIGHSGADYDTAIAAIDAGAESATHTMNAMQLLHQHRPAITGAVLERDVYCEVICDGFHLHPGTVRLILKTKGLDRVVAITDSIMAAGLPDGQYRLGVNDVTVSGGDAKLTGTDIRAGSTLTMDQALRNLVRFTGLPSEQVLPLLSENPANLLGWKQKGQIAPGMDADIAILTKDLYVRNVFVNGVLQAPAWFPL